jgi:ESCRT-I complex subunit TSG101
VPPPNPEKDALLRAIGAALHERRAEALAQTHAATLPALRAQHTAMRRTGAALQQELDALAALGATLAANERILAECMQRADAVMADARRRSGSGDGGGDDSLLLPAVDELLVAPTVVAQQLYRTVAEERALEDVTVVLARALDTGRIGLDVYLKVKPPPPKKTFSPLTKHIPYMTLFFSFEAPCYF